MKRPIVIAVIGYVIGIIMGLYLKESIVLLYLLIFLIIKTIQLIKRINKLKKNNLSITIKTLFYNCKINSRLDQKHKFNIYSISRYFRYLKLIFNHRILIILIIFSTISNTIILIMNYKYSTLYQGIQDVEAVAVITSSKREKEYKNIYKAKILEVNDSKKQKNTYVYLSVSKEIELNYGDRIKIKGEFKEPSQVRNYNGFNYKEYLKTQNIYGTINVANVEEIATKNDCSFFEIHINKLRERIYENANKYLNKKEYSIYLGMIFGDTSQIDENDILKFRNSSISHILAVSGMHISYIIIAITKILKKILGKRIAKLIAIVGVLFYICITGFSSSIARATVMGIMTLIGFLINRKNDTLTSMAISLFIVLIYNPYLIENVSFQFSYIGTIGIIFINKSILKALNKRKKKKSKVKEIFSMSLAVQIFIFPITLIHFNTVGIYFLISNLILGLILGPIIILSFVFLILCMFNLEIAKIIAIGLNFSIKIISLISNLSYLPMSCIYVKTPNFIEIIIWYIIIVWLKLLYKLKNKKKPSASNLRIKYILETIKYELRKKYKTKPKKRRNKIIVLILLLIIFIGIFLFYNRNLNIHFVDVGQGDCCFIETPNNKTILIDGGGSENNDFDVGKNILLPYILDRGYTKIDYIIISHFDTDHVKGLLTVMKELKVEKVIISRQGKISENYKKFTKTVKEKKIKVIFVEKGDRLAVEDDLYIDILWPNNSKLINENILNNNSIVCKVSYKNISIIFTGDIEEIAEKQILQEYKNNIKVLNSTILKVGHHGSKTSSTQEFLDIIRPKISLIGVGANNKFGHPNNEVIERLEKLGSKIYRTDKMGEITIVVDKNGRVQIKKL